MVFAGRKGATQTRPGTLPFDEVIATADVLSLHCPLTDETRSLIAAPEFDRMRRKPLIINTARGGLVDEEDLERALACGQISGAGFDVTLPEPPPLNSPLMRMAKRPNVIVTPHTAWASSEAQQALADQLIDNIEAFVAGQAKHLLVEAGR
ncbi:MAG: hypothetical protein B7X76_10755 [Azorhizobium sp. 39-67-5]|nr:MAG: hypothetical protein B7X76_10755 [Azorhizobium sp. 39-67-5]